MAGKQNIEAQSASPARAEQRDIVLEAAQAEAAFLRDELAAREVAIAEIAVRTQSQAAMIEELQALLAERDLALASTRRVAELRGGAAQRARTELIALQSALDAALAEAGERTATSELRLQKALAGRAQTDGALARAQQSAALRDAAAAAARAEVASLLDEPAEGRSAPASDPEPRRLVKANEATEVDPDFIDFANEPPPLVSIVCVTYQQEQFIAEAVGSILAQTYAPLDIIILDDASSDATADVVAETLARHPPRDDTRFVRNPRNLGFFANARKGLALARGDFIVVF